MQQLHITGIIVAAGRSRRMGFDKLFYQLNGVEVLLHTVRALDAAAGLDSLVVVAGENIDDVRQLLQANPPVKPLSVVAGGATRTDSVCAGLTACPNADFVAIHDGARPFVSLGLIERTLAAAIQYGAAAPALPMRDTMKRAENDFIQRTVERKGLYAIQTPQAFGRAAFEAALAAIPPEEYPDITDDCLVFERAGLPVRLVAGEGANLKITTPEDLDSGDAARHAAPPAGPLIRAGHGYDVHRLVEGRPLIIGGVDIPFEKGLLGHSDADVLLHAVTDAMLGAAALGDIGTHFPDSDAAYKGADSLELLRRAARLVREQGFAVSNIDATVLCQRPKLAPHIPAMRKRIAAALGVDTGRVGVKATTEEGLGFTGAGQGIAAHCVALLAGVSAG